jgi:hypothetical protein
LQPILRKILSTAFFLNSHLVWRAASFSYTSTFYKYSSFALMKSTFHQKAVSHFLSLPSVAMLQTRVSARQKKAPVREQAENACGEGAVQAARRRNAWLSFFGQRSGAGGATG